MADQESTDRETALAAAQREYLEARAERDFHTAHADLLANVKTFTQAEIFLDEGARNWLQAEVKDLQLVKEHGETPVAAAYDWNAPEHLAERMAEQAGELKTEAAGLTDSARELEARFNEIVAQPVEARDVDALNDLTRQMNELVDRSLEQWDGHVREAKESLGPESEAVLKAEAEFRHSYTVEAHPESSTSGAPVIEAVPDHVDAVHAPGNADSSASTSVHPGHEPAHDGSSTAEPLPTDGTHTADAPHVADASATMVHHDAGIDAADTSAT